MKDGDSDDADMDGPNSKNTGGFNDDITEANNSGTYNVEAADNGIVNSDYNSDNGADTDNADASPNAEYGVSNDIDDNDEGKDTNNPDIDDLDYTYAHHNPLFCLVWSSVALLN